MNLLTRIDAKPILEALKSEGYSPNLVGSILIKGYSNNDIDITLSIALEYDNTLFKGRINRSSPNLVRYYWGTENIGFKCIIKPEFAPIDTWRKDDIIVDVFFV